MTNKKKENKGEVVKMEDARIQSLTANKPDQMINQASEIANVLKKMIEDRKLYSPIQGKKYVNVEGWSTMGAMLQVFPYVEWSRKLDRQDEIIYEARVVLRTIKGELISAGEAMCSNKERNWQGRDEYAIRSMAETRATGKAFRIGFSWIMSLAGYEATPAEEIIKQDYTPITNKQKGLIEKLVNKNDGSIKQLEEFINKKLDSLNKQQASQVIQKLMERTKKIEQEQKADKNEPVVKQKKVKSKNDSQAVNKGEDPFADKPKTVTAGDDDINQDEIDEMFDKK